ncbi:MAG: hypothetical protein ACHQXJ_02605 [Nitrososphaerales archaeon]
MRFKGELKFFAEDFWELMEQQNHKCALTGRKFEPINTEIELKKPNLREGRFEKSNFYLINKSLSPLARYLSEDEIIELAIEIIQFRGKERGYSIRRNKAHENKTKE